MAGPRAESCAVCRTAIVPVDTSRVFWIQAKPKVAQIFLSSPLKVALSSSEEIHTAQAKEIRGSELLASIDLAPLALPPQPGSRSNVENCRQISGNFILIDANCSFAPCSRIEFHMELDLQPMSPSQPPPDGEICSFDSYMSEDQSPKCAGTADSSQVEPEFIPNLQDVKGVSVVHPISGYSASERTRENQQESNRRELEPRSPVSDGRARWSSIMHTEPFLRDCSHQSCALAHCSDDLVTNADSSEPGGCVLVRVDEALHLPPAVASTPDGCARQFVVQVDAPGCSLRTPPAAARLSAAGGAVVSWDHEFLVPWAKRESEVHKQLWLSFIALEPSKEMSHGSPSVCHYLFFLSFVMSCLFTFHFL
jgi:hypothetical protein